MRIGILFASVVLTACTGTSNPPNDASTVDGWQSNGFTSFTVTTLIGAVCQGDTPASMCQVGVQVTVRDLMNGAITDATVTVNDQPVPNTGSALYGRADTGLADSYRVVVVHGSDTYSTTLPAPHDFALTLSPATIATNTAATVTWTPANQGGVDVMAQVTPTAGSMFTFRGSSTDDGELMIPATAFPDPGTYTLEVVRTITPDQPDGGALTLPTQLQLNRRLRVTVQ